MSQLLISQLREGVARRAWAARQLQVRCFMEWDSIRERAHEIIDGHPAAPAIDLARALQAEFAGQPLLGWWILSSLAPERVEPQPQIKGK